MRDEIRKLIGTDKLVIGTDKVLSGMKRGEMAKVYVSSNAPPSVKQDIERYGNIADVEIAHLEVPNEEVGILCKKPFPVSVLGKKK